jgi:hypothetical protein
MSNTGQESASTAGDARLIACVECPLYARQDVGGVQAGLLTRTLNGPKSERRPRMATEAYCVKCRAKKTMNDEQEVTMKNGKPATQGICPDCGTKMFKIGKSK